jgi:hypothetical protein
MGILLRRFDIDDDCSGGMDVQVRGYFTRLIVLYTGPFWLRERREKAGMPAGRAVVFLFRVGIVFPQLIFF